MYILSKYPTYVPTVTPDNQYDRRGGSPYHPPAVISTESPQAFSGGGGAGANTPPLQTQINRLPIKD